MCQKQAGTCAVPTAHMHYQGLPWWSKHANPPRKVCNGCNSFLSTVRCARANATAQLIQASLSNGDGPGVLLLMYGLCWPLIKVGRTKVRQPKPPQFSEWSAFPVSLL